MRIGVLTVAADMGCAAVSAANARAYCAKHGYEFALKETLADDHAPATWNKILWLKKILGGYDFVFIKDCDSIFANFDLSLDSFALSPLCASRQHNPQTINFGHVMVQNCPENFELIDRMLTEPDALKDTGRHEQGVFNRLWARGDVSGLVVCEQHIFNAFHFPAKRLGIYSTICPDTVTVHWPGSCKQPGWVNLMKQLAEKALC